MQSHKEIGDALRAAHARLDSATWPDKRVDLYLPGERGLPAHHPRTWAKVRHRLADAGVVLHPGHRAERHDVSLSGVVVRSSVDASDRPVGHLPGSPRRPTG
jgi:hypothetical protein